MNGGILTLVMCCGVRLPDNRKFSVLCLVIRNGLNNCKNGDVAMRGFFTEKDQEINLRISFVVRDKTRYELVKNINPPFMSAKSIQEVEFAFGVIEREFEKQKAIYPRATLTVFINGMIKGEDWFIASDDLNELKRSMHNHINGSVNAPLYR
jgi:hypothetical protein